MPNASRGFFKFATFILNLIFKGKKPPKIYNYEQVNVGDSKIRTCVYSRKNSLNYNRPIVIWLHGGGYGLGIPEYEFSFIKEFLDCCDCIAISPDYTLSYKKPYPTALKECYEVLLWAYNNAEELGANRNCIIVGGDSAGGGLTVALCMYARDKKQVRITCQLPVYPMIDDRSTNSNRNNYAPMWNTTSNKKAWEIYLGEYYNLNSIPYYAAPARCDNYNDLPQAFTYIGDVDLFLDETKAYINNLKECGIRAEMLVLEGCYHGFDVLCPKSVVAKTARKFLREQFLKVINTCCNK